MLKRAQRFRGEATMPKTWSPSRAKTCIATSVSPLPGQCSLDNCPPKTPTPFTGLDSQVWPIGENYGSSAWKILGIWQTSLNRAARRQTNKPLLEYRVLKKEYLVRNRSREAFQANVFGRIQRWLMSSSEGLLLTYPFSVQDDQGGDNLRMTVSANARHCVSASTPVPSWRHCPYSSCRISNSSLSQQCILQPTEHKGPLTGSLRPLQIFSALVLSIYFPSESLGLC